MVRHLCPESTRRDFHLSPRLCPSTARCSPPSVPSIVFCLLLSCSKWSPPSLLCHLAIFRLVVLLISSLSLVCLVKKTFSQWIYFSLTHPTKNETPSVLKTVSVTFFLSILFLFLILFCRSKRMIESAVSRTRS